MAPSKSGLQLTFKKAMHPLRIHFVIPPISLKDRYGKFRTMGTHYPSLGIAAIAAIAEVKGHTVKVTDAEALRYSLEEVRRELEAFRPDIVGMPTLTMNIGLCYIIAKMVKGISPSTKVILGGSHLSLYAKQALEPGEVDFGIVSEAEIVFNDLLDALDQKEDFKGIHGLAYKDSKGQIHINPRQRLFPDLNQFPMPALHLFPMETYNSAAVLRGKKTLNIVSSRGCPYRCGFCASPQMYGRTYRFRNTENVIKEIQLLMDEYGADSIQFFDETFTVNKRRVMELCDEIIKRGLKFKWSCFARTDGVDKELLQKMKDAGCYLIFFGIESGVQRLLDIIKKDITLEQSRTAIRLCKEVGIQTWGSFILGIPSETEEESDETIRFAIELDVDWAQFAFFTPWPGTELYNIAKEQGNILDENLADYTLWVNAVYNPGPDRTAADVQRAVERANRRFYLRTRFLLRRGIDILLHHPREKIWQLKRAALASLF